MVKINLGLVPAQGAVKQGTGQSNVNLALIPGQSTIQALREDLQQNQPQTRIRPQGKQTGSFINRFAENIAAYPQGVYQTAVGLAKGIGTGAINIEQAVAKGLTEFTGRPYRPPQQTEEFRQKYLEPQTPTEAAFMPIGKAVPGIVGAVYLPGKKLQVANQGFNAALKALGFAGKSIAGTSLATGSMEGRLPTKEEIGAYGLLDLGLGLASRYGKNLFRSAFKGTQKQESNFLKRYGKTIGELAEELKVAPGTARQIESRQSRKLPKIWQALQQSASESAPVQRQIFKKVAQDIASRVTKGLPKSKLRSNLSQAIIDKVMFYAPSTKATGGEIVGIIKNLNKGLFGSGTQSVLNLKQLSSVENLLKGQLKKLLPPDAQKLYDTYSKNKLIKDVMSEEAVRKTMGRELLGASSGMQTAGIATGDPLSALLGAVAGKAAVKGATSTALKTVGGKALSSLEGVAQATGIKSLLQGLVTPKKQ